jgi:3'-5' exoribonuclease
VSSPRRNLPIGHWTDGDQVQGYAFLAVKELRQDRSGNRYLHLELCDASGRIQGKAWSDSPALGSDFEAADYVAFDGLVQSYRNQLQLNVRRCRRVRAEDREYGFDEARLVPTTKEDLDDLWRRLLALLQREIHRPELDRLVRHTLAEHGEALRVHPAAKTIHHAYRGGLLEHVVSMLELAVAVCDHYRDLDREIVLVAILYHDLGKILELGAMPANDYTPAGRMVGHVVLGRDLLREACAAVGIVPAEQRLHLEHLILSHQGRKEWGSPVEPMTREALVVHYVDDLDSKLAQLRQAQEQGGGFRFLPPLGRFVYLGEEVAGVGADEEPAAAAPVLEPTLFDD